MPPEWYISQVCEAFNCRPREALEEIEEDWCYLVPNILLLRAYKQTKEELDSAKKEEKASLSKKSPLHELATEFTFSRAKKRIEEQRRRAEEE